RALPDPSRLLFSLGIPRPPTSTLFPYTTLFRSNHCRTCAGSWLKRRPQARDRIPRRWVSPRRVRAPNIPATRQSPAQRPRHASRSEEHTSELQSRENLVCRLLLEKKTK